MEPPHIGYQMENSHQHHYFDFMMDIKTSLLGKSIQ